ncbi:MAG: hypothetical protein R3F62_05490 [Planctomycetota bacterium]
MTRVFVLSACLLALPVLAQDTPPPPADAPQEGDAGDGEDAGEPAEGEGEGQDAPKRRGKRNKAPAEPQGPVAQALADMLHVAPNYSEGRVELVYTFAGEDEIEDWVSKGFQRAEQTNNRGRVPRRPGAKKGQNRSLALATSREGLLIHKLPFLADVEVEITCHMERGATRSDLVLGIGDAGVRFGQAFVRKSGSGFKLVDQPFAEESPFANGRQATLTLTANGALFTAKTGKDDAASTDKLREKQAGQVFLYTTQAHLVVHRVVIRGALDLEKLKLN